jgi:hypothetical protein
MKSGKKFLGWAVKSGLEDLAKYFLYVGVGVPLVGLFLRITGVLPSNWVFPPVSGSQWFCATCLILYGGLLGISASALTLGRKVADSRVESLSTRLESSVSKLEDTLLKARFGDLWLSHPWDYVGYLEAVNQDYKVANPHGHLNEITLYGTMVGLSFLLPEPLFEHIKRTEGQFKKLWLIGSNAEAQLASNGSKEELSRFPIYLIAQLSQSLFRNNSPFPNWMIQGKTLKVGICYLNHDMLSAAILCRGQEAATLQALDSSVFQRIIKGEQAQPGFRYHNSRNVDAFDRVQAVLDNVKQQFDDDGLETAFARKCEVWQFSGIGTEPHLKIVNPHWKVDNEQNPTNVETIKGRIYDTDPLTIYNFVGLDTIRAIADLLLRHVLNLTPIDSLQPLVALHRANDWQMSRLRQVTPAVVP